MEPVLEVSVVFTILDSDDCSGKSIIHAVDNSVAISTAARTTMFEILGKPEGFKPRIHAMAS